MLFFDIAPHPTFQSVSCHFGNVSFKRRTQPLHQSETSYVMYAVMCIANHINYALHFSSLGSILLCKCGVCKGSQEICANPALFSSLSDLHRQNQRGHPVRIHRLSERGKSRAPFFCGWSALCRAWSLKNVAYDVPSMRSVIVRIDEVHKSMLQRSAITCHSLRVVLSV